MKYVTWLTGMPRSGTNWFAQIFASSPDVRLKLCPLFSYEFKNALDGDSTAQEWESFFGKVYETESDYLDQVYLRREGAVPEFTVKKDSPSHLVIKSTRFHNLTRAILDKHPSIRFVALIRHPCATIHSWLTNPLEFPEDADPDAEWLNGACRKKGSGEFWGFNDWKHVTLLHHDLADEYPERFLVVRYEALVKNAEKTVKQLFDALDIPYETQTEQFIQVSQSTHSNHKRAVFKKPAVKDRWKHEMDPAIAKKILNDLKGTPLARYTEE